MDSDGDVNPTIEANENYACAEVMKRCEHQHPVDRNVPEDSESIKYGCDNMTNDKKIAIALDKTGEFITSMGNQIGGILQSQKETNKVFELLGLFFDHTQQLNLALINHSEKMSAPEVRKYYFFAEMLARCFNLINVALVPPSVRLFHLQVISSRIDFTNSTQHTNEI